MLRIDIYVLASCLVWASTEAAEIASHKNWIRFCYYVGFGLVISDIWDRRIMNVRWVTKEDLILTILTGLIGLRQCFPKTYEVVFGKPERIIVSVLSKIAINPIKKLLNVTGKRPGDFEG